MFVGLDPSPGWDFGVWRFVGLIMDVEQTRRQIV
jgi:hypothetical protein